MALEHVEGAGVELETGMFDPGNGIEGQSGQKSAGGELKTYRNKVGEICSLYAVDSDESDIQFEGLMKTSGYEAKDVGATITITGVTLPTGGKCLVEEWEEVYQNDEVTKVRGKAHIYVIASTNSST